MGEFKFLALSIVAREPRDKRALVDAVSTARGLKPILVQTATYDKRLVFKKLLIFAVTLGLIHFAVYYFFIR